MRGRQPMPSKPPLVLVVEDNLDAQTITAAILAHRGYAVMKVGSVCEAREIVQRRRPDVVVLDCKLPDGDGLELAKQWRSDPMMRRIPIVVLTAFSARQDVEAALLAGVDAFLVKPVTSVVGGAHDADREGPWDTQVGHLSRTFAPPSATADKRRGEDEPLTANYPCALSDCCPIRVFMVKLWQSASLRQTWDPNFRVNRCIFSPGTAPAAALPMQHPAVELVHIPKRWGF
jgi:CheY-like chemotaxis protein